MNRLIKFGRNGVCIGQPISFMKKRDPPKVTTPPVIAGLSTVGSVLTRTAGVWTGATSVTWAWYAGTTLRQSGGATYTVVAGDAGQIVKVTETAVGVGGTTTRDSNGIVIT